MRDSVTQKMNLNFLFVNIDFVEDKHSHIRKQQVVDTTIDRFQTAVSQFAR